MSRPMDGAEFWKEYFANVLRVSWPDFAEAFEEFYLYSALPADILKILRGKVDPMRSGLVPYSRWQKTFQDHSCIASLIDSLLSETTKNIDSQIYRDEALPCLGEMPVPSLDKISGKSSVDKEDSKLPTKAPRSDDSTEKGQASTPGVVHPMGQPFPVNMPEIDSTSATPESFA